MVLRVDVMEAALRGFYGLDPVDLRRQRRVVALTPTGRVLDDRLVDELAAEPEVTLLCGRYEGFDERIVEHFASDAVSIGEYVLAGGELAAMVVCDAVLRKLPGALGDSASAKEESFSVALEGRPEYPHYTRPADHRGWHVPDVLLSGHHEEIRRWRESQSRARDELAQRHGQPVSRASRQRPQRAPSAGRGATRPRAPLSSPRSASRASPGTGPPASPGTPARLRRRRFATILPSALPTLRPRPLLAMSSVIEALERAQLRRVPSFQAGDRLRVHFQVIEGTRKRTQVFEGVVIKRQGHGARETFTVRKQSFGVGVERTFPVHSPKIEKIEVAARGDVRRAKLYYLRDRVGKRARVRERRYTGPEEKVVAGLLHDPAAQLEAEAAAEPEAVDADGAVAEETVAEASAAAGTAAGSEADAASTGE